LSLPHHCIGNGWLEGEGAPFESLNPVDQSLVLACREATSLEVDAAFRAAREAFATWGFEHQNTRSELVQKFAAQVQGQADELALLISRETGKPLWEAKTEVATVVGKSALAIDALHRRRETSRFEMGDQLAVTRFKPHGVVGVLGPYNFPAHLPNAHIVPAILAGNTVVFKPSEWTPAVGAWLMQRWIAAGLPAGVMNLVQGGRATGQAIAAHPQLDGLLFTGSSQAGRALHRAFADHPEKILALEMGGNNPLIVYRASNVRAAAYHTVLSAYLTAGQRCTCARRLILVDDGEPPAFLSALREQIGRLRVGFFTDHPEPFMGPVISVEAGRRLLAAYEELVRRGAEPLVPLRALRGCPALLSPGLVDSTGVAGDDEELFGPLLQVHRVGDFAAAIELANQTRYGLSAGLLSDDQAAYEQFIARIRAGVVNWNRQTTGASGKLPFGGIGLSGNHRPSGYFAADYCSYPVAALEAVSLDVPERLLPGIESPADRDQA
jgi:succinylglutamic semialdehyde dehydrogenase